MRQSIADLLEARTEPEITVPPNRARDSSKTSFYAGESIALTPLQLFPNPLYSRRNASVPRTSGVMIRMLEMGMHCDFLRPTPNDASLS
jgi:hypothetical protein